jgi:sugar phosphate isomerase/epimerase
MLSVSTSWVSSSCEDGPSLLAAMDKAPVECFELEYRITDPIYRSLRSTLPKSGRRVVSVHNFFPLPPFVPRLRASGDLFLLSDLDREERQCAVRWTTHSIECANDLEAGAVVLHCGKVEMDAQYSVARRYFDQGAIRSEEAQAFLASKMAERELKKRRHLDALLASLDRLLAVAEKHQVRLALENRAHYHELPGPGEFDEIFAEFDGAPLGYWHDVGHAHLHQVLTLAEPHALLNQHAERLIGIHLHDARGLDDHLPPGQGEVDFHVIRSFLKDDTLRVVELKPGTKPEQLREGVEHLARMAY